jgi:hypothetical protein
LAWVDEAMAGAVALPARDLDRLIKLCGLLTSDADGERATAARMASDLLRAHRLTWAEVLKAGGTVVREVRVERGPCPGCAAQAQARRSWRSAVALLCRVALEQPDLLNGWERRFVFSVGDQVRLSEKQHAVVMRLLERVLDAGVA